MTTRRQWQSLEAVLAEMEESDPVLKRLGDRVRGVYSRRERINAASKQRQAEARREWRRALPVDGAEQ